ncbi:MAG: signal transduction histidine kinase [Halieaceae bacterium]
MTVLRQKRTIEHNKKKMITAPHILNSKAYENGPALFVAWSMLACDCGERQLLKKDNYFAPAALAENHLVSRSQFLKILHKFTHSQTGLNTVDEIVWNIAKTVMAELGFEDCVVYLLDEDGKTLVQVAAHGKKNLVATEIMNPITIELGCGIVGTAARTGEFQLVSDTRKNTHYIVDDEIRLSELAVPIEHEGRVIGVLDSEHPQANFYTDEHVQLFTIVASLVSARIGTAMALGGLRAAETQTNEIQKEQESERKALTAQIIHASKLSTLGEMATSVAHELNQPLNIIRLAAGNSRRKISNGTADSDYLNNKLGRIEEQTVRAATIIDHMRMFGRQAKEETGPIDLRQIVTNALDLSGEQLRLTGIEIVTEFPEDCASVLGHAIPMEQVILNLLSNAKDAMAESNGKSKILLRVFEDDEGVHITSEDTGGGIPEDALSRIFEPFYTTKEMGKGTGLGLSLSYGIVRDMGGVIVAENIEDGARFTITLPSL